ncbi:MarR family winged helix-turn-helix transcriptional regulator [Micromonospora echinofusca]|uniref:MarR family transcriptional regulator n=1 Tax=Micromonospora echinofusca TaxID=47858 RepID=A0ABS3VLT4_MICEH|nr:MarR family transcriptional regulator [Micromonospora echinofusca]MBO4205485.1 MarR family transcriptional regulator [Micromonospora echinofusca]
MAAALDGVAGALLAVWDAAREHATSRLSGSQLRAVMTVEQQDGINLRRLAQSLGMLLSSASRLCDRLVAAGMLEREPGRTDRREISLHLTEAARELLREQRAERRRRLTEVLRAMSPEGQQALLRGLSEFDEVAREIAEPAAPLDPAADPYPSDTEPLPLDPAAEPAGPAVPVGGFGDVPEQLPRRPVRRRPARPADPTATVRSA